MKRNVLLAAMLALSGPTFAAPPATPVDAYRIVHVYPHDPHAFTEGLFYLDGHLWESTGLNGHSEIRRERLKDGAVLRSIRVDPRYFGEGIVDWGPDLYSLTWRDGIGFKFRRSDLRQIGSFHYPGEGWALTRNAREIIMSDGTPQLRILDPATMAERSRITVTDQGRPVSGLNELEWVKGEIFADIWLTGRIARIDPKTGHVTAWIDLSRLVAENRKDDPEAVLNGIAFDPAGNRLFVTGKNWPHLYEIVLVPPKR